MILDTAIFFILYMIAMFLVLLFGSFIYCSGQAVINYFKRKAREKAEINYLSNLDKNLSRRFDRNQ